MIYPAYQWGGGYTKSEVDTLLNSKANSSHTHSKSQITDFPSYGTTANTICEGNDSRLSDARTPTAHTHTKSEITDFPSLSTVATSGSYNDLSNKPTIPTVNNATLTIQKNGTTVKTFTANASSNVTANITVPTNTNQLTNGNGFITSEIDSSGTGWVRFKSGIQICYGSATNNNGLGDGSMRVSFSKAFNAKPNLTATPNISAGYLCTALVEGTSTWVFNTYAYSNGGINHVRDGLTCNFIAIGKWK